MGSVQMWKEKIIIEFKQFNKLNNEIEVLILK